MFTGVLATLNTPIEKTDGSPALPLQRAAAGSGWWRLTLITKLTKRSDQR